MRNERAVSLATVHRGHLICPNVQEKNAFLDRNHSGAWHAGAQFAAEPELCRMFNASRTVIRQALKDLDHDGVITREKGRGAFVAKP